MSRIAILGSTGMLGSTLTKYLSDGHNQVLEFNRAGKSVIPGNFCEALDVTNEQSIYEFLNYGNFDYIVNGVGLIKQRINEDIESDVALAYKVNSDFPSILNAYSENSSVPVIQIGTDCVYSGSEGLYDESSEFNCSDIYGLSKVSGESRSRSLMTIRCSIIGHEMQSKVSLMDWFLNQDLDAEVKGFTNHIWNGVTTLEFAKITAGIISSGNISKGITHLIPADQVSKFELLNILARSFNRADISIKAFEAQTAVNRTLSTIYPERNSEMWANAGYNQAPTVQEMVQKYALWSS